MIYILYGVLGFIVIDYFRIKYWKFIYKRKEKKSDKIYKNRYGGKL